MPRTVRHWLLLACLVVLAVPPTIDGAHRPHPATGAPQVTVALAASHAEQSPHFEAAEIVPLAPCSICLLQRSARSTDESPAITPPRPRRGRPQTLEHHALARRTGARAARAPPLS